MKVDVIYYKTNTDFEMEFNLCGCCRMRLLTDKAPDRKTGSPGMQGRILSLKGKKSPWRNNQSWWT